MLDEAILANAIPIVDTPMSDPAWPWAPGQNGYLAPLGILYPSEKESLARYGINSTYQECAFSDGAPSTFSLYWMALNCGSIQAAKKAAKNLGVIDGTNPETASGSTGNGGIGAVWRVLFEEMSAMGKEEIKLRQVINLEWYRITIEAIQARIVQASIFRREGLNGAAGRRLIRPSQCDILEKSRV